jgi:plastocyanin
MPRRRAAAVLVAAIIQVVAPATAHAATYEVYAGHDDLKSAPKQVSPNAFFPRTVTVHPNDTVRWDFRGFHTVTFPVKGKQPPPLALAATDVPVRDVRDAAGNPFWFNNQPSVVLNPVAVGKSVNKTWNGSRVLGSGIPTGSKPKPFVLRFQKTGTVTYYCAVHPGMRGTVHIVASSRRAPSPAATAAKGNREAKRYLLAARRATAAPVPGGATVQAGRTTSTFAVYRFFPATRTVPAGQPVTFTMAKEFRSEIHTITFGPEKVRANLERNFIGPVPGASPGTLGLNPRGVYASDPPPSLPAYDGANHGDGFLNSGLIDNDPASPFPGAVTITFSKPGTYHYECVIHEHMDGTIKVV